jgi:hypothetical protein
MTIAAIKSNLEKAGVPTWGMIVIEGPDGQPEVSVDYEILQDHANPDMIHAMSFSSTDKGLCFS